MYVRMYVCLYACTHECIYVCVYMYVYMSPRDHCATTSTHMTSSSSTMGRTEFGGTTRDLVDGWKKQRNRGKNATYES